jgi:hypothetical protein
VRGESGHPAPIEETPLFPANRVSIQDVTLGLAEDVERAYKAAEQIEISARVSATDMCLQVTM